MRRQESSGLLPSRAPRAPQKQVSTRRADEPTHAIHLPAPGAARVDRRAAVPPPPCLQGARGRLLCVVLAVAGLLAGLVFVASYGYEPAGEEGVGGGWAARPWVVSLSWGAPPEEVPNYDDPERAEAVRRAMKHAWHGYERYAWGADELRPASKQGKSGVTGGMNGFNGLGASIVDAMSTLHVMGFHDEFQRSAERGRARSRY